MNFFFATLFGFFLAVQASPWVAPGVTLDVYDPAIILPNADSFWKAGEPQLVVWNTTGYPAQITNPKGGFITLNYPDNSTHLLADKIDILSGQQFVTIPADAPSGDSYYITLFGDSGNTSDDFTIEACPKPDPESN